MDDVAIIIAIEFALLLILVALSAFFSGSETALFSLSRARLFAYKSDPIPARRCISELMEDYHRTLITIVMGNMFVNTCISMLNNEILENLKLNRFLLLALSIFITIVILLLFGEITPKAIAILNAEKFAEFAARKIYFMKWALSPVIMTANKVFSVILDALGRKKQAPLNAEEYSTYIEMAHSVGAFSESETEMLCNIFMLRKNKLSRVMRARTNIEYISNSMSYNEVAEMIRKSGQLFYPIVNESIDDAEKILSARDLFMLDEARKKDWANQSCAIKAIFIPENTSLLKALTNMKKNKMPVAFAIDEYGGISGMVYLKDIYEEIIGEIDIEYDVPDWEIKKLGENKWKINGQIATSDLAEIIDWTTPEDIANTINGIFLDTLERIPEKGDKVRLDNIEITAINIKNNRVCEADVIYPCEFREEDI